MKYFLFISIFLYGFNYLAQDTIYRKNGEQISAKIIEINKEEVKYRKLSPGNDSVYTLDKNRIFIVKLSDLKFRARDLKSLDFPRNLQILKFSEIKRKRSKYFCNDTAISQNEALLIMKDYAYQKNNYELDKLIRHAIHNNSLEKQYLNCGFSNLTVATFGIWAGSLLYQANGGTGGMNETQGGLITIGLATLTIGTIFEFSAIFHGMDKKIEIRKALEIYNNSLKSSGSK